MPRSTLPWLLMAGALAVALRARTWQQMAAITAALFWLAKYLVLWRPEGATAWTAPIGRWCAWFLAWPGMDPRGFFDPTRRPAPVPRSQEVAAYAFLILGALLLAVTAWAEHRLPLWTCGLLALLALALLLLHGLLSLTSVWLRRAGIYAPPIFHSPLLAASPADFWGRRWNRAFREMARSLVLRPLRGHRASGVAPALVFLLSGLAHDLIVSVPAQGGYGGPTSYFLLQGLGLRLERSRWGRPLRAGWGGRAFAWIWVAGPLPLLFHRPFLERVVLPLLEDLRALA